VKSLSGTSEDSAETIDTESYRRQWSFKLILKGVNFMDKRSEQINLLDVLTKAVTALNEKIKNEYLNLLEVVYDQEDKRPIMLSITQAAETVGVSAYAVRKWAKNGTISAVRVGTKIFVNMQSLSDYFNNSHLVADIHENKEGIFPIYKEEIFYVR
jgi:excisionase family DNA binding protein